VEKIGFNLPAEMLEVYKVKVAAQMQQGQTTTDVSCDLLIALIERAQAWIRLEADEREFQKEQRNGPSVMG
jgi:hypothetical protein